MKQDLESVHASRMRHHAGAFPALDALLLFFFCNLALQPLVDPDFGWHLRTGLDLVNNGWRMPATDPYSHTMPDWPWVEHAWLADGIIGLIYSGLGSAGGVGVIFFFAVIIGAAFISATALARASRTSRLTAIAAAAWTALPFLGARIQMISLLGLAVLLWLLRLAEGCPESAWAIPGLFLLWANLHGGFTAGLFLLAVVLAVSWAVHLAMAQWPEAARWIHEPILSWSTLRRLSLVSVLAALVTVINPYGWRLHIEIYRSLTDQFMIDTLREWQPVSLEYRSGIIYVGYLGLLAVLLLCCYRQIEPVRWAVLLVFLILSLRHWRNVPLFLIVSIPLLAELVEKSARGASDHLPVWRSSKPWLLTLTGVLALSMVSLGSDHLKKVLHCGSAPAEYFRGTEYPIEAVVWISEHGQDVGARLYNDYGLGGFLLWWLPHTKIFIDGRMPAWRLGERWIFYDYVALAAWTPPELAVLDKYEVDWAIVGRSTPLAEALERHPRWRLLYQDAKVGVYAWRAG